MNALLLFIGMPALIAGPLAADVISNYDGDTLTAWVYTWPGTAQRANIRIRGIDAPEMKGRCAAEEELAVKARDRLREILASGAVTLENVQPDKYGGRFDADVLVDGKPVGAQLVAEGLARPYSGGKREGWCR